MSLPPDEKPTILYVDSENQNLVSFHAIFRREYKIISASSTEEALKVLEKELVEIVVCSKNIGALTGVDFLASTICHWPNISRLLVSDYGDQDPDEKAQILDYLIKPWDTCQVEKIVKEASILFRTKQLITGNFW